MSLHRINQQKLKRYIGDRTFYKAVLIISVPIMIQNGITNFVGLLDNIMICRVGTEQMSGASVVNQLIFVYNLINNAHYLDRIVRIKKYKFRIIAESVILKGLRKASESCSCDNRRMKRASGIPSGISS